jgi:hypothetical protein
MYCSSCGSAVPPGLSYCKRCGTDLRVKDPAAGERRGASPDTLVWGMVGITTIGLIAILSLMKMKGVDPGNDGLLNGFAGLAFLSFVLIDAFFAGLLLRSKKTPRAKTDINQLKEVIRAELQAAQTSGLAEPASVVTDHTTRTLEPVPLKRD